MCCIQYISSIYSCGSSLLGLHIQGKCIRSRKIFHSPQMQKQRNKHAQYTQFPPVPNRVLAAQLFLSSSICLAPSFHMVYVTVPFPCPGATYTQGKHRVVCVDDCQQRPFIICQASVLRGGKYTQWIMVVLVSEQNPTWQAAEGHDKIILEEIVYHGRGKHCPSRAQEECQLLNFLKGGRARADGMGKRKRWHQRCNSTWRKGGEKQQNHCVFPVPLWFDIHTCQSRSVSKVKTEYGSNCN